MARFTKDQSIKDFQDFNHQVYGPIDDRFYSVSDLVIQHQRFAMRSLKGIRKGEEERLKNNLLVSFSFLMAVGNRLHIDIEEETWERFPALCSYCGRQPCVCKKMKPSKRAQLRKKDEGLRPRSIAGFQEMFEAVASSWSPGTKQRIADVVSSSVPPLGGP